MATRIISLGGVVKRFLTAFCISVLHLIGLPSERTIHAAGSGQQPVLKAWAIQLRARCGRLQGYLILFLTAFLPAGLLSFPSLNQEYIESEEWRKHYQFIVAACKTDILFHEIFVALIVANFLSGTRTAIVLMLLQVSLLWILASVIQSRMIIENVSGLRSVASGRLWRMHLSQLHFAPANLNPIHVMAFPHISTVLAIAHLLLAWFLLIVNAGCSDTAAPPSTFDQPSIGFKIVLAVHFAFGLMSVLTVAYVWRRFLLVRSSDSHIV